MAFLDEVANPNTYYASTETELRAINVPPLNFGDVCIMDSVGTRPRAKMIWNSDCDELDNPDIGCVKPDGVAANDPGRWIWSDWVY